MRNKLIEKCMSVFYFMASDVQNECVDAASLFLCLICSVKIFEKEGSEIYTQ